MPNVRPVIQAALNYALTQERLDLSVVGGQQPKVLGEGKWNRILYNAEFYMRRQGTIKLV